MFYYGKCLFDFLGNLMVFLNNAIVNFQLQKIRQGCSSGKDMSCDVYRWFYIFVFVLDILLMDLKRYLYL